MAENDREDHYIEQALASERNNEVRTICALVSIAISQQRIANAAETDTRDYFAGLALQGLIAHHGDAAWNPESEIQSMEGAAEFAFQYADAMMAARGR